MTLSFVSGCMVLLLLTSCNLFKQGRYKVINGMKFHSFTLDNKLEVLAISDKRFVKSSASLAVMAGSMQNPDEHLGLAHFLEHMLFLGTKEYPKVGDYENFLNKNDIKCMKQKIWPHFLCKSNFFLVEGSNLVI